MGLSRLWVVGPDAYHRPSCPVGGISRARSQAEPAMARSPEKKGLPELRLLSRVAGEDGGVLERAKI